MGAILGLAKAVDVGRADGDGEAGLQRPSFPQGLGVPFTKTCADPLLHKLPRGARASTQTRPAAHSVSSALPPTGPAARPSGALGTHTAFLGSVEGQLCGVRRPWQIVKQRFACSEPEPWSLYPLLELSAGRPHPCSGLPSPLRRKMPCSLLHTSAQGFTHSDEPGWAHRVAAWVPDAGGRRAQGSETGSSFLLAMAGARPLEGFAACLSPTSPRDSTCSARPCGRAQWPRAWSELDGRSEHGWPPLRSECPRVSEKRQK